MPAMRLEHVLLFLVVCIATWFLVISSWPRMLLAVYKRAILRKGFGDGPIPLNTLRTQPQQLFADPLHPPASAPRVATSGVNRDTLLTIGWLDLHGGPRVLHVPDMAGRYYSVQFTDPSKNINFAYVGKRATGTGEGDFVICGPGWRGAVQQGMARIDSPGDSVLVIGRVFVGNERDLPAAHALASQIQVAPLAVREPGP